MKTNLLVLFSLILTVGFLNACDPLGNNNTTSLPVHDDYYSFSQSFDDFFDPTKIHELKLTVSFEEWMNLSNDIVESYGSSRIHTEILRDATFSNETSGEYFDHVGIRVRGNTTRDIPEYNGYWWPVHWKISFSTQFEGCEAVYGSDEIGTYLKAQRKMYGVRSLNLKYAFKDPSYTVEGTSFALFEEAGVPAPRFTFANLTIEIPGYADVNCGTFYVFEPIDKEFVQRRWGTNAYLFKCLYQNGPADLNAYSSSWDGRDLIGMEQTDPLDMSEAASWDPSSDPYHPAYDLKTLESDFSGAKTALEALIDGINNNYGSSFSNFIVNNFDVETFLKAMALDALVGTKDGYWGNFNNYYLVLCPTNQKWTFIPYDYDQTFTNNYYGNGHESTDSATNWGRVAGWGSGSSAVLMDKLLEDDYFRNRYETYLLEFTDPDTGIFTWSNISSKVTAYQSVLSPYANASDIIQHNSLPETYYDSDRDETIVIWTGFYPAQYNPVMENWVLDRLTVVSNELR